MPAARRPSVGSGSPGLRVPRSARSRAVQRDRLARSEVGPPAHHRQRQRPRGRRAVDAGQRDDEPRPGRRCSPRPRITSPRSPAPRRRPRSPRPAPVRARRAARPAPPAPRPRRRTRSSRRHAARRPRATAIASAATTAAATPDRQPSAPRQRTRVAGDERDAPDDQAHAVMFGGARARLLSPVVGQYQLRPTMNAKMFTSPPSL